MAGAVFGSIMFEGVSPMFRDNVYSYARSLARMSGFARQVRINGRSVQEDDEDRLHQVINIDDDASPAANGMSCGAQFSIINR
jgi:hypothetical protein